MLEGGLERVEMMFSLVLGDNSASSGRRGGNARQRNSLEAGLGPQDEPGMCAGKGCGVLAKMCLLSHTKNKGALKAPTIL